MAIGFVLGPDEADGCSGSFFTSTTSSSSAPDAHIVTENSPSSVFIETCFCCQQPPPPPDEPFNEGDRSLGETAAAEASNVDGGGDNDDEELDAIRREGS